MTTDERLAELRAHSERSWGQPTWAAVTFLLAELDAARAKDAEEIADLTRKLRVFLSFPCHWTRGEIEYTTDCGQVAFPVTSVPDGQCHGCGRPIVVS